VLVVVGQVAEHRAHLGQERAGVERAGGGVAAGGAQDEVVDGGRDARHDGARRRDVLVHVPVGDRQRAVGLVRRRPGQQLPEHDAGGVDVGARVGAAVDDLLGGEVGDGAEQQAGGGGEGGGLDGAGQPEVGDLDPAVVGDQQVLGLDVAVHQARGVRGGQRAQDGLEQRERLRRGQGALLAQQRPDGAARHVLHDQVGGAGGGVLALVEDPHDVRGCSAARLPGPRG
jgi:hypothetical protein